MIAAPKVPDQCNCCINFDKEEMICKHYDTLPGEYGREDVEECPSFYAEDKSEELALLVKYIDEDPDMLVEKRLEEVVSKIVSGYEEKFKIMIVGVARRKIKSMVRMVDIIDTLLEKLSIAVKEDSLTTNQTLRLLSDLNSSINNDLTFIMKLVNPDTQLRDLQMWVDARSVINVNGTSKETEVKTDEILKMTGASRDKVREAFDALLNRIPTDEDETMDVYVPSEEEEEELENL